MEICFLGGTFGRLRLGIGGCMGGWWVGVLKRKILRGRRVALVAWLLLIVCRLLQDRRRVGVGVLLGWVLRGRWIGLERVWLLLMVCVMFLFLDGRRV